MSEVGPEHLELVPLEAHQHLRGAQGTLSSVISSTVKREMVREVRAAATADIEYPCTRRVTRMWRIRASSYTIFKDDSKSSLSGSTGMTYFASSV